jgi:hypothetical protein
VRADTAFRNERLQRGLVVGSLCPKVAAAIPRSRERNTQGAALPPVLTPLGRTLACCSSVVLGLGRKLAPVTLGGIQPHVAWPDGFVAVIALLVPLASSASEALGIHALSTPSRQARVSATPGRATKTRMTQLARSSLRPCARYVNIHVSSGQQPGHPYVRCAHHVRPRG